ncbi:MAG: MarR family transcriptional regulator [Actinomycetota bacterium]|nr:MarR family transcriptional regulator [Actinomycetota bacterium]
MHNVAERLALVLSGQGLQRMTARVLAALLFTEQTSVTMAELAEDLDASAGSISGALKSLTSVGLVEQVPAPGSRRDHFRLRPDAWATLYTGQNQTIAAFLDAADAGIAATGRTSLAREKLTEMRDFYAFLMAEIPAVLERWHARDR